MAEIEDRRLSVDEIGKYLGVSSDTVYRRIDKNGMPAHRMAASGSSKRNRSMHGSAPAARLIRADRIRQNE